MIIFTKRPVVSSFDTTGPAFDNTHQAFSTNTRPYSMEKFANLNIRACYKILKKHDKQG